MVFQESVRKRLERLEIYLTHLDELKKISERDFLIDWKSQDVVLRNFQVAIETCIDIGANIISQEGLGIPETYVQIFETLANRGILPKKFSERFKDLAKFRNIIVHEYLYVDYKKVYKNLQRIDDLREYIRCIVEYLSKRKG